MTKTTFVNNQNPFASPPKPAKKTASSPKKHRTSLDPDTLVIGDDPYPGSAQTQRWEAKFDAMKPEQCIFCASHQVKTIANAMRDYVRRKFGQSRVVRSRKDYPRLGDGRVWIRQREINGSEE